MLKYRPKQFWNMIKPNHAQSLDIPVATLIEHNKKIFWNEHIEDEEYTPINNKERNYITEDELK
jgi:LEA14-like dessication related protein